jgi:fumarylacetoacetase
MLRGGAGVRCRSIFRAVPPTAPLLDETHDPGLRSWISAANLPDTDFPIQNLPFGIFATAGSDGRVGIAIGDQILDVGAAAETGVFTGAARDAAGRCRGSSLNALFAAGRGPLQALRAQASAFLRADRAPGGDAAALAGRLLVPMATARLSLPVAVGDYTDFYASVYHATNVGQIFRPGAALLPNYKHAPIGYHGRSSSIVVSGTSVQRPCGQTREPGDPAPTFGPTRMLDYEAELGFLVGAGNTREESIAIDRAQEHLAGVCLVNDWSARDVQAWESQPLGPFLAKSFATTLSPWVVTFDALAPFRVSAPARPAGDPTPLPYLLSSATGADTWDVTIEVSLCSRQMRDAAIPPVRLSTGRLADLYWTPAQLVAHHTSNGCNLRPGDLLASGTISGPAPDTLGCLLELTVRGARPITLPSGEHRGFLEDGDEVILRGRCERAGAVSLGFGSCRGTVHGARDAIDVSPHLPHAAHPA